MPTSTASHAKPSFVDLFLGANPSVTRSSKGLRLVVNKNKQPEVVADTATPEPAQGPPPPAAPAVETPAPPAPEPAAEPVAVVEPVIVTETSGAVWSETEDAILIGARTQGKSWNEIHELIPNKSKADLKQRFKELSLDVKGKGRARVVSLNEGSKKDAKRGILKAAGDETDVTDDEGIDPRGLPMSDVRNGKKTKKTGTLKIIEVNRDEEEIADLKGHPIVYINPDTGLSEAHMKILYKLTRKNDEVKWLEIASRFFDKTGKRMEPDVLKQMLRNL